MFLHKTIVRHIVIEGADHVIAIAPHFLIHEIKFMPKRLRVAHQVEPMAAPAFAEVRGGEQFVHHLLKGLGRIVGHEGLYLFRCGR